MQYPIAFFGILLKHRIIVKFLFGFFDTGLIFNNKYVYFRMNSKIKNDHFKIFNGAFLKKKILSYYVTRNQSKQH